MINPNVLVGINLYWQTPLETLKAKDKLVEKKLINIDLIIYNMASYRIKLFYGFDC